MPPLWPVDTTPVENSDSPVVEINSKPSRGLTIFAYILIALYVLFFWDKVTSVSYPDNGQWTGLGDIVVSVASFYIFTLLALVGLFVAVKLFGRNKILALVLGILAAIILLIVSRNFL